MAAISNSFSLFICFIHLSLALSPNRATAGGGFTVDLIHRDHPKSPFYHPASTKLDRLANAIHRSFSRAARIKRCISHSPNNIQSQIIPTSGEYLMNVSLGTPPFQTLGVADTGSDLTWTQCKPCDQCYDQRSPLFDPTSSSTYKTLTCQSDACQSIPTSQCSETNNCQYKVMYGDQSYSVGDLAVETFTFASSSGRPVSSQKLVFGCSHSAGGTFNGTASGIIGLGGGPVSLVSQLGNSIGSKFSYCLTADQQSTSKISFGEPAIVSGPGVVSTPIVRKEVETFYYLSLESVSVGDKRVAFVTKMPSDESDDDGSGGGSQDGNIIIDSGTTLTLLPTQLYSDLETELKQAIKSEPTQDPQELLNLCYSDNDIAVPNLTFNFAGAKLSLPPTSTFVQNGELICLAMMPADDIAIFGNLSQMNFLIGYDIEKSEISFKPTDCSKH